MRAFAIATLLLALPLAAHAQSQTVVPVVTGIVASEHGPNFLGYVADRMDGIIGIKVIVETTPTGSQDDYQAYGDMESRRLTMSQYDGLNQVGIELNVDALYAQGWRIDGYFMPKYVGMGQGQMAIFLEPVDAAAVILNPSVKLEEHRVETLTPISD